MDVIPKPIRNRHWRTIQHRRSSSSIDSRRTRNNKWETTASI